jgi:hypothetical protein
MATYQVWAAPISDTLGHFQALAQFFGGGFTTLGWQAQSGHGEVVATGTGASYAFTTPVLPGTVSILAPNQYTFKGAYSSGTAYVGANSSGAAGEVDLVTAGGVTYQCIVAANQYVLTSAAISGTTVTYTGTITNGSGNALVGATFTIAGFANSGNNGTFVITASTVTTLVCTNAAGVNETHAGTANCNPTTANGIIWAPLQFEIWKSNGANTASLPLYMRLTYTTAGTNGYRVILALGTGIDSNGNITNPVPLNTGAPYCALLDNSTSSTSVLGEMDMSGDADNVRIVTWRNAAALMSSVNYNNILVVDRAKTSTGADTDAFAYVGSCLAQGTAQVAKSAIILNPQQGGVVLSGVLQNQNGWMGAVTWAGFNASAVVMGSAAVAPIFPLVGYCANPLLGAVCIHQNDYKGSDGAIIPVWTYGAVHSYMVLTGITAAAGMLDNVASNGTNPAILWE